MHASADANQKIKEIKTEKPEHGSPSGLARERERPVCYAKY